MDEKYTYKKMINLLKKHNIKLDHHYHKIEKFKIFGLTICKIKVFQNKKQIILFNQIRFYINNKN